MLSTKRPGAVSYWTEEEWNSSSTQDRLMFSRGGEFAEFRTNIREKEGEFFHVLTRFNEDRARRFCEFYGRECEIFPEDRNPNLDLIRVRVGPKGSA